MRLHTISYLLVAAVVLAPAAPAMAQNAPKVDLAASFSALYDRDLASETLGTGGWMPTGWVAAGSARVRGPLSIAGEVGANYMSFHYADLDQRRDAYTFLGGVRYAPRVHSRVTPFMQLLAGVARYTLSAVGDSFSTYGFGSEFGGGVDVGVSKKLAVRIQGDYRYIRVRGSNGNEFRLATGIVYRF
jgi:hypothetical protein